MMFVALIKFTVFYKQEIKIYHIFQCEADKVSGNLRFYVNLMALVS